MKKIHILLSYLREIVDRFKFHRLCFYPVSVFPVGTICGNLSKIDLRVKVCGKRISMITAVTVQNINGMDFIKIMLQGIGTEYTGNTRIKTGSQKSSQSCFLKFLIISPLPGIIEICSKAFFFTSLFIDCTPCGIFCILCFIIGSINIIRTGFQTCIHDGKILIWKCHIQDSIRLIGSDQFCDLCCIIRIYLCCLNFCLRCTFNLLFECIAFFLCPACDHNLCKNIAVLTAFANCH